MAQVGEHLPSKYEDLSSNVLPEKKTQNKKQSTFYWTGGVTQVVECLFHKHKALSSNPSPTSQK
jgi:hypothetical protein